MDNFPKDLSQEEKQIGVDAALAVFQKNSTPFRMCCYLLMNMIETKPEGDALTKAEKNMMKLWKKADHAAQKAIEEKTGKSMKDYALGIFRRKAPDSATGDSIELTMTPRVFETAAAALAMEAKRRREGVTLQ